MSVELVDTETGEVVGQMMSADEARQGFAELRTGAEGLVPIYMRLLEGKAWLSLGYGSMQEAVDAEVGQGFRLAVTRAERRQVVAASLLAEPEASNVEHARRTGASDKTVQVVREEMAGRSEIPNVAERTDSLGRQQPATKPDPALPDDADLQRLQLRSAFLRAESQAHNLATFDPVALSMALTADDFERLGHVRRGINDFLDRLNDARPKGLRLVNGD